MNGIFALTQHIYLSKKNRLPLKVTEFNINTLIDQISQLFPKLIISKDQNLNENNK